MVTPPEDRLKLVGTVVAEKYSIERVLREDDFVVDYRATQLIVNRELVVRVFAGLAQVEGHTRSHLYNDYLMDQAKLAELLSAAPALRPIRDTGTLPGPGGDWLAFAVEDYPRGTPLSEVLNELRRTGKAYSWPEAVRVLDPVAVALAHAHNARLVHGRVSADDVRLLDDGVALHNFALPKLACRARELSQIPIDGPAAPEPRTGTTPSIDVFGLACLLVQMCGERPAADGAVGALIERAMDDRSPKAWRDAGEFWTALHGALELPPLRGLAKTIPPDVVRDAAVQSPLARTRLLIMSITLLLVGLAIGILRSSCAPEAPKQSPGQGAVTGH